MAWQFRLDDNACFVCKSPVLPLALVSGHADEADSFREHPVATCQNEREGLKAIVAASPEVVLGLFREPATGFYETLMVAARNGNLIVARFLLSGPGVLRSSGYPFHRRAHLRRTDDIMEEYGPCYWPVSP